MEQLMRYLFTPPPMPVIALPLPARLVPAIKMTIVKAFELAYYRGVWDGFVAGVLLVLILVPLARGLVKIGARR